MGILHLNSNLNLHSNLEDYIEMNVTESSATRKFVKGTLKLTKPLQLNESNQWYGSVLHFSRA